MRVVVAVVQPVPGAARQAQRQLRLGVQPLRLDVQPLARQVSRVQLPHHVVR